MTMKSVPDCLNFIDSMMLCDIEKHAGIRNLEDLPDYMITLYNDKYIEDMFSMLAIFSQINLIVDRFFLDNRVILKNNILLEENAY